MEILIMNSAGEFISAILIFILLSMTEDKKKKSYRYSFAIGIGVGVKYSVWEAIWTTVKIFVCMH